MKKSRFFPLLSVLFFFISCGKSDSALHIDFFQFYPPNPQRWLQKDIDINAVSYKSLSLVPKYVFKANEFNAVLVVSDMYSTDKTFTFSTDFKEYYQKLLTQLKETNSVTDKESKLETVSIKEIVSTNDKLVSIKAFFITDNVNEDSICIDFFCNADEYSSVRTDIIQFLSHVSYSDTY